MCGGGSAPSEPSVFQGQCLDAHNAYRAQYGAPALTWDGNLASKAADRASEIASTGSSTATNKGENLGSATGYELTGQAVTDMWFDEVKLYDFNNPSAQPGTEHFTQLVWVGSKKMGVAKAVGQGGKQYVVARYDPAGNVTGKFQDNVKPKGTPVPLPVLRGGGGCCIL